MNWINIAKVVLIGIASAAYVIFIMMIESTNRLVFAIGYHFLV